MSTSPAHIRSAAVRDALEAAGIEHELIEHEPTFRADDEARAVDEPLDVVAKIVVLRDGDARILALVSAFDRIDLHRVRETLGAGHSLRLATEEEIAADFPEFEVGAVSPIGHLTAVELVDSHLLEPERIVCPAGDHTHAVRLAPADLVKATGARVARISVDD
jgi:prolyl-tRNA editing enzyme YbaK/EbsC (Cys-tRNA(Pro) deacylase)